MEAESNSDVDRIRRVYQHQAEMNLDIVVSGGVNRYVLDPAFCSVQPIHKPSEILPRSLDTNSPNVAPTSPESIASRMADPGKHVNDCGTLAPKCFPHAKPWTDTSGLTSKRLHGDPTSHIWDVYEFERLLAENRWTNLPSLLAVQRMISREVEWQFFVFPKALSVPHTERPNLSSTPSARIIKQSSTCRLIGWNVHLNKTHWAFILFDRETSSAFYIDSLISEESFKAALQAFADCLKQIGWSGTVHARALPMLKQGSSFACGLTILESLELLVLREWPAGSVGQLQWDEDLGWARRLGLWLKMPGVAAQMTGQQFDWALKAKYQAVCRSELRADPKTPLYQGKGRQWNFASAAILHGPLTIRADPKTVDTA